MRNGYAVEAWQNGKRGRLLCAVSVLALTAGLSLPVCAQDDATNSIETVTVTSTRVERAGYIAPTPVTSVTNQEIQQQAPTSMADILSALPSIRTAGTPQTSGANSLGGGQITANLRGLDSTRTLVLVNGKRFVPVSANGTSDLTQIPTLLIDRVEVVTGGASAAYGSDAVAGVVNIILKNHVDGLLGSLQYGESKYGDNIEEQGSLAYGGSALSDKFTYMVGANYINNEGISGQYSRPWGRKEVGLITNTAYATNGLPNYIISPMDHTSTATNGGLILSAKTNTGGKSSALNGIAFGPGGVPYPFQFGTVFGTSMIGGEQQWPNPTLDAQLGKPFTATSLLGHFEYEFNSDLKAYVDISASRTTAGGHGQQMIDRGLVIPVDNAYLPPSIKAAMVANNLASITIGRYYADVYSDPGHRKQDDADVAHLNFNTRNKTGRIIAGLEGKVFGDWTWDVNYQFGENRYNLVYGPNNKNVGNFALAVDAVVNPSTGNIVCRSSLIDPTNGCIPVNILGDGSWEYNSFVNGSATYSLIMDQTVADVDLKGNPFSTWAGPVSIATGFEYRREAARAVADAVSKQINPDGSNGGWDHGNQIDFAGAYNIYEGYLETVVPVLNGLRFAEEADINAAVRFTNYSTAGNATTWKFGFNYQPIGDLRIRGTRSHDVRAPNLQELFQGGTGSNFTTINDRVAGTVLIRQIGTGNLDLKPEGAETWTGGVVYQPSWLPGFALSVDYYNILVKDVISRLVAPILLNGCYAGNALYCQSVVFKPDGSVNYIVSQFLNLNQLKTSGVDFEGSYNFDADALDIPGTFSLHVLATYRNELTTIQPGNVAQNVIGKVSDYQRTGGEPKWKGLASVTWDSEPWSINVRARYYGAGVYNPDFTTGAGAKNTISNNEVGSQIYFDLGGSYDLNAWGAKAQLYGRIQNLFDRDPPFVPSQTAGGTDESSTNAAFYDVIGRLFKVGIRFSMN